MASCINCNNILCKLCFKGVLIKINILNPFLVFLALGGMCMVNYNQMMIIEDHTLAIKIDIVVVVSIGNNIWLITAQQYIQLLAVHIPGRENDTADLLYR